MRTKDSLTKIDEIATLEKYLYLSEEHKIAIENSIGVKFIVKMDDDGNFMALNTNFPEFPEFNWNEVMTLKTLAAIVDQLKKAPAEEFPNRFTNRWEEIQTITSMNLIQNAN